MDFDGIRAVTSVLLVTRRRKHRARETLFEDGSKAGKHFLHDLIGDGLDVPSLPGADIECARLVAADHAGRSGTCALERDGKATPAGEASTRGDGQDYRRTCQLVERRYRVRRKIQASQARVRAAKMRWKPAPAMAAAVRCQSW